jgi:UbiD family decarboxylase
MRADARTLTLHISSAHHGALNLGQYHARAEPAPVAVSFGHHPLYLVLGGLSVPFALSEYQMAGAIFGEPVPVVCGEITGLPLPAHSEFVVEGFCPPGELREEGPFGEYTGYYASGRGREPILAVEAVYHRPAPIVLGAMPARPPHDYSYFMAAMKSANVKEALARDGIPDIRGVWYHEAAGVNFFVVVSLRQRYPGHARQAAYVAAPCRAGGTSLGRYVVVVDDDVDPSNIDDVLWAIGTRTNPEVDIDLLRNTYSNPLDPIYRKTGSNVMFGSRAIIDACRPFDWLDQFPAVAQASPDARERVRQKWQHVLE